MICYTEIIFIQKVLLNTYFLPKFTYNKCPLYVKLHASGSSIIVCMYNIYVWPTEHTVHNQMAHIKHQEKKLRKLLLPCKS